jgi:hypothetical protein
MYEYVYACGGGIERQNDEKGERTNEERNERLKDQKIKSMEEGCVQE